MPVSVHACVVTGVKQRKRSFRFLFVHSPKYLFRLKQPGWLLPEWVWELCNPHGLQLFVRAQLGPVLRITMYKLLNKKCGKATASYRVLYLPYVTLIWGNSAENRRAEEN